jgi:hypothetical protein
MELTAFKALLSRIEAMFRGSDATRQADAIKQFREAVASSDARTVEQFAQRAEHALSQPDLIELPVEAIAARLVSARTDKLAFNVVYGALSAKSAPKDKVVAVAQAFTGSSKGYASKPAALKAIKSYFDQRAYLAAKADRDARVTPW